MPAVFCAWCRYGAFFTQPGPEETSCPYEIERSRQLHGLSALNTCAQTASGPAERGPSRPVVQRAVTVTGCMKFFTTYSPILRPMSSPTRVENR